MTRSERTQQRVLRRFSADERGEFLASMLVMIVGVLLVIGFTVDAGRLLAARRDLNDTASQAAIAGAQQVDGQAVLDGRAELGLEAIVAANAYLAAEGVAGSASVVGDQVVVEATGEYSPIMFGGFGNQTLTGQGTARAVRGVDDAES